MTTSIRTMSIHFTRSPSSTHSVFCWRGICKLCISQPRLDAVESPNQLKTVSASRRRLDTWMRLFHREQRLALMPRIEKITVDYTGKIGDKRSMRMTKGISAPIDCAKHLSQLLVDQSAVAVVNGKPWDLHRPLTDNCRVDFVHFKDAYHDPMVANEAFWRSSAFLLAATLETAFRPHHQVRLLSLFSSNSFPSNGAFSCDIAFTPSLGKSNPDAWWRPTGRDLRMISLHAQRLAASKFSFEVVDMPLEVVQNELFGSEPVRQNQIRLQMSSKEANSDIPVYRLGDYVEVCPDSPLITSTKLVGRFAVTCIRPLGWLSHQHLRSTASESSLKTVVYRAYGIALPTAFLTHFTTFDRLIRWAASSYREMVDSDLPDYVIGP